MAEASKTNGTADDRIARLTRAYGLILGRYREIERLAREERELLQGGGDCIANINALLGQKKAALAEIRETEERVKGAREWWKKVRRTLPADAGSELLALLDATSRAVERLLALETECRGLLERRTAWGGRGDPSPIGAGSVAREAYGRTTTIGGRTR